MEYLIQDTTLQGIADAIRSKTGGTAQIAVSDMAAQIDSIQTKQDLSFVTAGAEQILSGYVGADKDGNPVYGQKTVKFTEITLTNSNFSRFISSSNSSNGTVQGVKLNLTLDGEYDYVFITAKAKMTVGGSKTHGFSFDLQWNVNAGTVDGILTSRSNSLDFTVQNSGYSCSSIPGNVSISGNTLSVYKDGSGMTYYNSDKKFSSPVCISGKAFCVKI